VSWLLDVLATDAKGPVQMIASFRQAVKEGDLGIHPPLARLVHADNPVPEKVTSGCQTNGATEPFAARQEMSRGSAAPLVQPA
jgi:hypothetical protein